MDILSASNGRAPIVLDVNRRDRLMELGTSNMDGWMDRWMA